MNSLPGSNPFHERVKIVWNYDIFTKKTHLDMLIQIMLLFEKHQPGDILEVFSCFPNSSTMVYFEKIDHESLRVTFLNNSVTMSKNSNNGYIVSKSYYENELLELTLG